MINPFSLSNCKATSSGDENLHHLFFTFFLFIFLSNQTPPTQPKHSLSRPPCPPAHFLQAQPRNPLQFSGQRCCFWLSLSLPLFSFSLHWSTLSSTSGTLSFTALEPVLLTPQLLSSSTGLATKRSNPPLMDSTPETPSAKGAPAQCSGACCAMASPWRSRSSTQRRFRRSVSSRTS